MFSRYFGFLVSFLCIFLLSGLLFALRNFTQHENASSCFSKEQERSEIILQLNQKFEKSFATEDSLTREQWQIALASDLERRQMTQLIQLILSLDNFDDIHSSEQFLRPFTQLAKSIDISVLGKYCVIHEKLNSKTGKFPRYWGYTVVNSKQWTKRPYLHHSAAHFQSDGQVCSQAAVLLSELKQELWLLLVLLGLQSKEN
uniref:Uncharacterized protein n=1 Tax=Ditylenchus dipsaci TaxID=166011 RepID=A0A915D042_9BILA